MRIYLDNAATTPIASAVFEAMLPYLQTYFGNPSSVHAEGRQAKVAIETARKAFAKALGVQPKNLIFTSGGTESNNTAIKCAVQDLGVKRIITSPIEHACVSNSVKHLEDSKRVEVTYVNLLPTGAADLDNLGKLLGESPQKTLVSLMHANNELATLNDIEAIGNLCRTHNALFHSDTVQTIGHLPINLAELPIDFASASAHKMHGPKGVGLLYINPTISIKPLIDGGGQERKQRSGTENVASIVGFRKALELALEQMPTWQKELDKLRTYFIQQLHDRLPKVRVSGDRKDYLYTILHVAFPCTLDLSVLLFRLDLEGIAASAGSACNSGAVQSSPVSDFLDLPEGYQALRFSFSYLNTIAEIDKTVDALATVLAPK